MKRERSRGERYACGLRYSPEERARAVELYKSDGMSHATAATGASRTAVLQWVRSAGVAPVRSGRRFAHAWLTPARAMAAYREHGCMMARTARALGVPFSTFRKRLHGGGPR